MNDEMHCFPRWISGRFSGCEACESCERLLRSRGVRKDQIGAEGRIRFAERKTIGE